MVFVSNTNEWASRIKRDDELNSLKSPSEKANSLCIQNRPFGFDADRLMWTETFMEFPEIFLLFLAILFCLHIFTDGKTSKHAKRRKNCFCQNKWSSLYYHFVSDRYKKNIKAFYIVHPSNFIKVAYAIMSPFLRYVSWILVNA